MYVKRTRNGIYSDHAAIKMASTFIQNTSNRKFAERNKTERRLDWWKKLKCSIIANCFSLNVDNHMQNNQRAKSKNICPQCNGDKRTALKTLELVLFQNETSKSDTGTLHILECGLHHSTGPNIGTPEITVKSQIHPHRMHFWAQNVSDFCVDP